MTWIRKVALVASLAALCLGCGAPGGGGKGGSAQPRLNGGGSSFVYPMMTKWASEYNKAKGAEVNYQSVGSGAGIQQMTAKTFDFGCTDGPMNEEQLKAAMAKGGDVLHIPLVMGAVVPAYNLEEVKQPLVFTGPILADIFMGKITQWNDKALQALNPDVPLPDKKIVVVHRSEGSGTTYIWVDYLCKVSDEWKQKVGVGTSVNWPLGEGAKGNEAVAGRVRSAPGGLGYIELTYALQSKIPFGLVKNKKGKAIKADLDTVTAAASNALKEIPDDLRYSITDADGDDSYPITGTVWAVIYKQQPVEKGKAVVDFLRWITHDGQQYAASLQYASLPKGLVERVEKKLDGVSFGGD